MCKIEVRKFKELRSTYFSEMTKGNFPKCGIKYTGKYSHGLVLVKYNVPGIEAIKEKARAANDTISHVFVIPKAAAMAVGI